VQLSREKELGAFYTPPSIAQYLADWAITDITRSVLEPCIGGGALVSAILRRFGNAPKGRLVGYEVDPEIFAKTSLLFEDRRAKLYCGDFLGLMPNAVGRFDAVIANPPFTRNHALSSERKGELRQREFASKVVSGAPGLWIYFLLASLEFINPGGRLAFVVPAAVQFTDYAQPILEHLRQNFINVLISIIDEPLEWEGKAQERAALIFASGYCQGSAQEVLWNRLARGDQDQWTVVSERKQAIQLPHVELGSVAKLEIGIVTGANSIFIVNRRIAELCELPESALVPVVARSRHVRSININQHHLNELAAGGERTLLLAPGELGPRGGPVRKYLAQINAQKRRSTAWFRKRTPWWKVQFGATPDAVLTYMNHSGPRLALVEEGLFSTNTLHHVLFFDRDVSIRQTACISMLSTYTQVHAENIGRVYGGGVLKFELGDARRIPLLIPLQPVDSAVFNRIDTSLRSGAWDTARELADEAILPAVVGRGWRRWREELLTRLAEARLSRGVRTIRQARHG
jgi:tRNA1(Val) A37 N6-methylase TrmN6